MIKEILITETEANEKQDKINSQNNLGSNINTMITPTNYTQQSINPANLPNNLIEGYNFTTGETAGFKHLELYNDDATIKAAIDKHIAELNNFFATKTKNKKATTAVPSVSKTKSKKLLKVTEKLSSKVEQIPLEVQIIKRFLAFHNKTKTRKQIMVLLDFIQKAIIDKRIKKTNYAANNVDYLQRLLIKIYNDMVTEKQDKIVCQIKPNRFENLTEIVNEFEAYKSIPLIKRYIALDGEFNSKEKVQKLYNDIAKFLDKVKSDKYEDNLLKIAARLKKYLANNETVLAIDEVALAGFMWAKYARKALHASKYAKDAVSQGYQKLKPHILNVGTKIKTSASKIYQNLDEKLQKKEMQSLQGVNEMFVNANNVDENKPINTFELKGDIGKLIGKIEQKKLAITIEGDQGGGKSQLMFQLADAFINANKKTAVFSLEMPVDSIPAKSFINEYISPLNKEKIKLASEAPEGLLSIKKAADYFDVIFIDSWGKLKVKSEEFDELRKQYPNTIFVVIFQRTSANKIRGGTEPLYDAGINIEVKKVDETFINNYAITTKNRYAQAGLKYNISKRQIIS